MPEDGSKQAEACRHARGSIARLSSSGEAVAVIVVSRRALVSIGGALDSSSVVLVCPPDMKLDGSNAADEPYKTGRFGALEFRATDCPRRGKHYSGPRFWIMRMAPMRKTAATTPAEPRT
jgi:hypothetical protein